MDRRGLSSMIAKSFSATKIKLKGLIVCPRKDVTADFAIQEVLFSDLKRLSEVEENLRNLRVPMKPSNGGEESSVEFAKRRAAEIQKEAYEAEIARLNEKIYGIQYSRESKTEDEECSGSEYRIPMNKEPPQWERSSDRGALKLSCPSSSDISIISLDSSASDESMWTSYNSKTNSKVEDLDTVVEKNETLKNQLHSIYGNQGATKEIIELKGSVDRCCAYLYELEEENKKLREENIKLRVENDEMGKLQETLEEVRKERDAYATVLKCEKRIAGEQDKGKSKPKVNDIEDAETRKEWKAKISQDTDALLQRKEVGGGDMERVEFDWAKHFEASCKSWSKTLEASCNPHVVTQAI